MFVSSTSASPAVIEFVYNTLVVLVGPESVDTSKVALLRFEGSFINPANGPAGIEHFAAGVEGRMPTAFQVTRILKFGQPGLTFRIFIGSW